MSEAWSLPGYDVQRLVGSGASGEVWAAREVATGELVALKRLRPGADLRAVETLRRESAALLRLDTPYVLRLREVVGEGESTVLVLDYAAGGSLADLLAARGTLDPGEVVTIAGPLAQALAAAHARGLVHGDVTPANILFTAEGMPLLADLGTARLAAQQSWQSQATAEYLDPAVARGDEPGPSADVWALAAVCHHMLAGAPPHEGEAVDDVLAAAADGGRAPLGLLAPRAPRALVEAVEAALVPDPDARPDAAAFASSVRRAYAAAPVRLRPGTAPAPPSAERPTHAVPRHAARSAPAHARPRLARRLLTVAAAAVLLAAAASVGWLSGRSSDPMPSVVPLATVAPTPAADPAPADPTPSRAPGPTPLPARPDWPTLLAQLDAAREHAFATGDVAKLADVYAPGSPGLALDEALLGQLVAQGQRARGVRHTVRSVELQEIDGPSARLRVVDVLAAYEIVGADGAVVARVPPREHAPFVVDVALTDSGWRLVEVRPG